METQRDQFDQRYETSRFEQSLICGDATIAREQMQLQQSKNIEKYQNRKYDHYCRFARETVSAKTAGVAIQLKATGDRRIKPQGLASQESRAIKIERARRAEAVRGKGGFAQDLE